MSGNAIHFLVKNHYPTNYAAKTQIPKSKGVVRFLLVLLDIRFHLRLNLINVLFNFIEILTLFREARTKGLQFLLLTLFHILVIRDRSKTDEVDNADKLVWRNGEREGRSTMSSAAFSLLLKVSLDATPPGLVPPTAPINQSVAREGPIDRPQDSGMLMCTCVVCD